MNSNGVLFKYFWIPLISTLETTFVGKLAKEIDHATAIIAIISKDYSFSRWAQAELYHAIALKKLVIPLLIPKDALNDSDEPLKRLLRDTQYLATEQELTVPGAIQSLGALLAKARSRHIADLLKQSTSLLLLGAALAFAVFWAVSQSNELEMPEDVRVLSSK